VAEPSAYFSLTAKWGGQSRVSAAGGVSQRVWSCRGSVKEQMGDNERADSNHSLDAT
jgi:hypothetical protein